MDARFEFFLDRLPTKIVFTEALSRIVHKFSEGAVKHFAEPRKITSILVLLYQLVLIVVNSIVQLSIIVLFILSVDFTTTRVEFQVRWGKQ